jgi:hypothetical protein
MKAIHAVGACIAKGTRFFLKPPVYPANRAVGGEPIGTKGEETWEAAGRNGFRVPAAEPKKLAETTAPNTIRKSAIE